MPVPVGFAVGERLAYADKEARQIHDSSVKEPRDPVPQPLAPRDEQVRVLQPLQAFDAVWVAESFGKL